MAECTPDVLHRCTQKSPQINLFIISKKKNLQAVLVPFVMAQTPPHHTALLLSIRVPSTVDLHFRHLRPPPCGPSQDGYGYTVKVVEALGDLQPF